jgi:hypothetical protein
VWITSISTTLKYNSSHRRHEVGGSLSMLCLREMALATLAQCEMLAGCAHRVWWERCKINSGPSGCEEGNGSRMSFCSSDRATCSKFAQSEWKRCQVETTSGQSWSRQAHPLEVSGWTGAVYQPISHVCSNIQGNVGQPSTEQRLPLASLKERLVVSPNRLGTKTNWLAVNRQL